MPACRLHVPGIAHPMASPQPNEAEQTAAATTIEKYVRAKAAKMKPPTVPEDEVAPRSEPTKAGPSRWQSSSALGSAIGERKSSPTAGMNAFHAINFMKRSSELSKSAIKAREDRERQQRMDAHGLTFDELFAKRERDQAVAALSDVAKLKRDVQQVRQRLKNSDRFLLSNEGWFIKFFDVLTLLALLYTMFVTPYEIGFLSPETASLMLEVGNYLMLLIFFGGMVVRARNLSELPPCALCLAWF